MFYALLYDYVDDIVTLRAPFRDPHLGLVGEFADRGEIVLAGALADPVDGAIIVFRGESPAIVESFVARDPYILNGLVPRHSIRPWTIVSGAHRLEG